MQSYQTRTQWADITPMLQARLVRKLCHYLAFYAAREALTRYRLQADGPVPIAKIAYREKFSVRAHRAKKHAACD